MLIKALVKLIAIALAVLFAITAVGKLQHYARFRSQLQRFPVDLSVLYVQAWVIPVTELIIAIMLLLPVSRLKGLFASLFLLGVYTLYLTCMLKSRFHCTCSCGEPIQSLTLKTHSVVTLGCVFLRGVGVVLSGRLVQPSQHDLKKAPFVQRYYEQINKTLINSRN
jgi:uncharacterized membrane protein YphA (DoxX/SURF4 family)